MDEQGRMLGSLNASDLRLFLAQQGVQTEDGLERWELLQMAFAAAAERADASALSSTMAASIAANLAALGSGGTGTSETPKTRRRSP